MGVNFDRWTLLKLFEFALVVACLVFKRVTDDEASRLFLYLQKLSREWSLLNNVTWDRVGSAVADATYGGYIIITGALFIGRLIGELPTQKRIIEYILLGIGAILFIILGSLAFASLDSVPPDLVDNAAVVGTLSLVTGALFLLDMGGPKAKKVRSEVYHQTQVPKISRPAAPRSISQQVFEIEKEIERSERNYDENDNNRAKGKHRKDKENGFKKVGDVNRGYKQMKDDDNGAPKRFGIYGKDVVDYKRDSDSEEELPPKMQEQSPVWSNIRKGHYGKVEVVHPSYIYPSAQRDEDRPPSGPGDPGYVQYTAQHWGESKKQLKTPRTSPTQV